MSHFVVRSFTIFADVGFLIFPSKVSDRLEKSIMS